MTEQASLCFLNLDALSFFSLKRVTSRRTMIPTSKMVHIERPIILTSRSDGHNKKDEFPHTEKTKEKELD